MVFFFTEKQLIQAFRIDCQSLIMRFELNYNTHFQNFCEIWRDMQFNLIFTYVFHFFIKKMLFLNISNLLLIY